MKSTIWFLILFIFSVIALPAMDGEIELDTTQNNILFFKDPRIDVLEKIYTYKKSNPFKNIRVHVFQATNRDAVFEMKNEFSKRFPGIPTFISYQAPNFKLRVGDFETNQEASAFLKKVKPFFPSSFVIEETVKAKP
jgi:hypothetical protein